MLSFLSRLESLISVSLLVGCWWVGSASAQDPKRVAVLSFKGPHAEQVRAHALSALSKRADIEIVPEREVESAAQRIGASLPSATGFQSVASELGLSAFIEGEVESSKQSTAATIRVRNGETGEVLHEETWSRKKLPQLKAIRSNFWEVMGSHIQTSSPPAKQEKLPEPAVVAQERTPEPAATTAEQEPPQPAAARGNAGPALIATLGPRAMWRTLAYENDALGNLRTYENEAASPAINAALSARFYAGALSGSGWFSNLGIDAAFDYAIGLKSKEGNKTRSTTAYDLSAGLHYRIPLDMFEPVVSVGYARQVFDVQAGAATLLPSVAYSAARFGLGTAIRIVDRVALDVHFDYFFILGADDLTSEAYFPDASGFGFDAGAGLYVGVVGSFGLRLAVDFRRYAFDLNAPTTPQPGGAKDAEAMTDDYLRAGLSLVYTLEGKASAGSDPSKGQ
jgi:hypothetical protein